MAVEKFGASGHFACKISGQNRSSFRKKRSDSGFEETRLHGALRAIAINHPAWGRRKPRWCLLTPELDGMALNNKRIRPLWREEGLVCEPKAGKKRRTLPGAGDHTRVSRILVWERESAIGGTGKIAPEAATFAGTLATRIQLAPSKDPNT